MRRLLSITFAAVALAALHAAPASASHGQQPHNCLGAFHSSAAQVVQLGPIVAALAGEPMLRPFGATVVSEFATTCVRPI